MPRKLRKSRKSKQKKQIGGASKTKKLVYQDNALNRRLGRVGKAYSKRYAYSSRQFQSGGSRTEYAYSALPEVRDWVIGGHRKPNISQMLDMAARNEGLVSQLAETNPKAKKAYQAYLAFKALQPQGHAGQYGPPQGQYGPPTGRYGPPQGQYGSPPRQRPYGAAPPQSHRQIQQIPGISDWLMNRPLPPRPDY